MFQALLHFTKHNNPRTEIPPRTDRPEDTVKLPDVALKIVLGDSLKLVLDQPVCLGVEDGHTVVEEFCVLVDGLQSEDNGWKVVLFGIVFEGGVCEVRKGEELSAQILFDLLQQHRVLEELTVVMEAFESINLSFQSVRFQYRLMEETVDHFRDALFETSSVLLVDFAETVCEGEL